MSHLLFIKKNESSLLLKINVRYFQFQHQCIEGLKVIPFSLPKKPKTNKKKFKQLDRLKISDLLHPLKDRIHRADAT